MRILEQKFRSRTDPVLCPFYFQFILLFFLYIFHYITFSFNTSFHYSFFFILSFISFRSFKLFVFFFLLDSISPARVRYYGKPGFLCWCKTKFWVEKGFSLLLFFFYFTFFISFSLCHISFGKIHSTPMFYFYDARWNITKKPSIFIFFLSFLHFFIYSLYIYVFF